MTRLAAAGLLRAMIRPVRGRRATEPARRRGPKEKWFVRERFGGG